MGRVLAIDFGERRIGLAISDPLKITAQGLPTIDTHITRDVLSCIQSIIKEKNITKVVVGMPRNMDGSIGFKGKQVKKFIGKLTQKIGVEVVAWDERLTSVQSKRSMKEMGTKQRKKGEVDRISATLILQSYLESFSKKAEDA